MQGILELAPTLIQFRAIINLEHLVEVRLEPHMAEQDVISKTGPGGRTKPKKVGKRMVPTGNTNLQITTLATGYSLTFEHAKNAGQMYDEINLCINTNGGKAQDLTSQDQQQIKLQRAAAAAAGAAKVDDNGDPIVPDKVGISDAATAEVEADGFEAEPVIYNNQYVCSGCECEYEFECSDPEFVIACPDCNSENSPVKEDLLG